MHKILFLFMALSMLVVSASGQTSTSASISNSTLVSTSNGLPFWLWANTDGKIKEGNSFLNLSTIEGNGVHFFNASKSFIKAGAEINYGIGNNDKYFLANQLFTSVNFNNWEFNFGKYYDELQFEGLSTSNGNIAKSRNARPYTRIGIRVADYKPVPWLGNFLFFKGEFDEGFLYDDRYVDKTHLHHKSFYLKFQTNENFSVEGGMEHFVMWGGTSQDPRYGELPDDLSAYWKYITGQSGDDQFPETDQQNVAGNQYGTYQLRITKKFEKFEAQFNLSHPFEDLSGVNWRNWPDNILTFSVKMNKKEQFINHILYEFTDTRQQGITDSLYRWVEDEQYWYRIHTDNYYSHGVYRSGVTHQQNMMSSPLFKPVKIEDGISRGPESTRFFAHHIGVKGKLHSDVAWQGMLTYIQHIGNWGNEYDPARKQVSGLINFIYAGEAVPFQIDLTLAGDIDNFQTDRLGVQIGLNYNF